MIFWARFITALLAMAALNDVCLASGGADAQRAEHLRALLIALRQYSVEHGQLPDQLPVNKPVEICRLSSRSLCGKMFDIGPLIGTYLTAIPSDPYAGQSLWTGYRLLRMESGRIQAIAVGQSRDLIVQSQDFPENVFKSEPTPEMPNCDQGQRREWDQIDLCAVEQAADSSKVEECGKLPEAEGRSLCYATYAIRLRDSTLCESTGSNVCAARVLQEQATTLPYKCAALDYKPAEQLFCYMLSKDSWFDASCKPYPTCITLAAQAFSDRRLCGGISYFSRDTYLRANCERQFGWADLDYLLLASFAGVLAVAIAITKNHVSRRRRGSASCSPSKAATPDHACE